MHDSRGRAKPKRCEANGLTQLRPRMVMWLCKGFRLRFCLCIYACMYSIGLGWVGLGLTIKEIFTCTQLIDRI